MSPQRRFVVAALAGMLAVAAVLLHFVEPPSRRVNIRWAPTASPDDVGRLERQFTLGRGELQDGRTWHYVLADESRANIARIVRHPAVEDTHFLNRTRFTIAQGLSIVPRWLRVFKRAGVARIGETVWLWVGLAAALVVLTMTWSVRRRPLFVILGVSLLVRLTLVFAGGQFYWPDEVRFVEARETLQAITEGRLGDAVGRLASPGALFNAIALVPAVAELPFGPTPIIPGVFFALFSVGNIWLTWRVARALRASERESLLAAALMAMSTSLLYFARHLVPYDVAMTFGLLALLAGVGSEPSARQPLLAGFLAACTFLAYPGYWTLAAAVLLVHVCVARDLLDAVRRALLAGVGGAGTVGLFAGVSTALGGRFVELSRSYAGTVTQGSFEEGWRLPWEYLWHTEHMLLVAWIGGFLWAAHRLLTTAGSSHLVRAGVVGVLAVYLLLVLSSSVLHVFVVYGRLVRQIVPFFCLATAAALAHGAASRSARVRALAHAGLVAMTLQACLNVLGPLRQSFPAEFVRDGRRDDRYNRDVVIVYTHPISSRPDPVTLPARYDTLHEAPHPLQFPPYQYEGFTPAEREVLRTADIRMRMLAPLP